MPLHPMLQMMADNAKESGRGMSLREGSVEDARTGYDAMGAMGGDLPELASKVDSSLPGPAGDVPIRIYTPTGDGPLPVVVFFHGGGFTIGSLTSHDPVAHKLAAESGAIVVAVDYRLAPEHKFPAAVEDCFAALQWVGANASSFGGDSSRLAVCGDSAGGNLSAVSCLLARDAGGPDVAFQALIYPTTDARGGYPSIVENGEGLFLSADTMLWFYEQYGRSDEDKSDWRASPILAEDLSNLPPALIITAEYDPLRDEGEAYGEALRAAGNTVTVKRYDGMTHVFVQLAAMLEEGRQAIAESAAAMRLAFGTAVG
jgi:acetyl esterase